MSDIWTTREGTEIPIKIMGISHLINTKKMLERNAKANHTKTLSLYLCCTAPTSDMAGLAFEEEVNNVINREWDDYLPEQYYTIKAEIEKRLQHEG